MVETHAHADATRGRSTCLVERNLIVERVRAGMRWAKLEGRHIGRRPVDIDRAAVLRERARGQSLSEIVGSLRVSHATNSRIVRTAITTPALQNLAIEESYGFGVLNGGQAITGSSVTPVLTEHRRRRRSIISSA